MKHHLFSRSIWLLIAIFSYSHPLYAAEPPPLPLAHNYQQNIEISQYWVSEKLDGVRAYWDGKQLISKNGNPFSVPEWFTDAFPAQPLDGELWMGRNQFEKLLSTLRQQPINHNLWRKVRYMVFDLPVKGIPFEQRLIKIRQVINAHPSPYLSIVEQYQLSTHAELMEILNQTTKSGGEGLMLHNGSARYTAGRSNNLLKLKEYQDAEATVVGYQSGKGKYTGLVGSLIVVDKKGNRFKLGSGLSDQQRKQPPPIASTVTYRFNGRTINGLPRFARFLRVYVEL